MPSEINETHDPKLTSWVESANAPSNDFPIQNLPFCLYRPASGEPALCVRIGDELLSIGALARLALLPEFPELAGATPLDGNALASLAWRPDKLRARLIHLLRSENEELRDHDERASAMLPVPGDDDLDALDTPFLCVGDYTDFYASVHHATNVGSMFRPNNPLLANYKWLPVGYHGRASSLVASGADVRRPRGQQAPVEEGGVPSFGPCKMLDYELEVGFFIARGNELGTDVPIDRAESHIFGICLVNDWSARDIQKWEYQPLGPFLAKSFATTVSPYVVTMEALAPFRSPAYKRPQGDPKPLPHLFGETDQSSGAIDLTLEVYLASEKMRDQGMDPIHISTGNLKDMYWTFAQMLAHHTSNGCNVQTGDLMASGTVSGPTRDSRGSLLELTWDGDPWSEPPHVVPGTERTPIELPTGEQRKFLADGDEVIIKGYCERDGYRRIGLGECRGTIVGAE